MTYLLVDVDTGVDDALALLFIARHPELELLAVSCVAGNTDVDNVVRNTLDVLHLAGAGAVPVGRGVERPLIAPRRPASGFHGSQGLAGLMIPQSPHPVAPMPAVELLRQAIIDSAEPPTLLALGPLTNIALLLRMYPDEAALLEKIVFMGGSTGSGNASPVAEFNVWHDPEAAAIVLDAPVPVVMYGLDVFYDVSVSAADCARLQACADPALRLAGDLLHYSALYGKDDSGFAPGGLIGDAGAACFIAYPELVTAKSFPVSIELSAGISRGQTIVDRRDAPGEQELHGENAMQRTIEVAMAVDAREMAHLFLKTICEGEPK